MKGRRWAKYLPPLSACRPVYIDYALRRFKVAVQAPEGPATARQRLQEAVQALADPKSGLVELVDESRQADWIVRLDQGKVELVEASGNRPRSSCRRRTTRRWRMPSARAWRRSTGPATWLPCPAGSRGSESRQPRGGRRCGGAAAQGPNRRRRGPAGPGRRVGLPARRSDLVPHCTTRASRSSWTSRC